MRVQNIFLLYFLKKLVTPFVKTKAYELGLIDENGKRLRKISSLKTSQEKKAMTRLDIFIWNVKRIIERFPLGKSRLATIAVAAFLLKEHKEILKNRLDESEIFIETIAESLMENVAANSSGSGNLAGVNDDSKLKKQMFLRRKAKKAVGKDPEDYLETPEI